MAKNRLQERLGELRGMISLMVGVAILTATGWSFNRAFGVPAPVWSAREAGKETT
jgi:hypothetical protein